MARTGSTIAAVAPRLIEVAAPADASGVVLVLHGGASRERSMRVSPAQLSVLRMIPIAHRARLAGRGELAVFRLLNSRRGWDTSHTPVLDVAWALDRVAELLGGRLPTCLIGHSLGARAALLASAAAEVRSAVALAPWVYPDDMPARPAGRAYLFIHGSDDRVASPARSAALARRMAGLAEVSYVVVKGGGHAMLARRSLFDGLAADYAAAALLGRRSASPIMRRIEAGERWIEV
jgi:pimeloyl-ACP methyl ester carboxylesterase